MNNKFTLLDCNDDDVILFEKETFKVSRLKELLSKEIATKLNQPLFIAQNRNHSDGTTITSTFRQVSISFENIKVDEIQVNFIIACQILQVGGKGWQKGNLKSQVKQSMIDKSLIVYLEFHFDRPNELESPLDEIRQMMKS